LCTNNKDHTNVRVFHVPANVLQEFDLHLDRVCSVVVSLANHVMLHDFVPSLSTWHQQVLLLWIWHLFPGYAIGLRHPLSSMMLAGFSTCTGGSLYHRGMLTHRQSSPSSANGHSVSPSRVPFHSLVQCLSSHGKSCLNELRICQSCKSTAAPLT